MMVYWFVKQGVTTLDAYIVLATLVTQLQVVKDMLLSSSAEPQIYLGITWYIRYITLLSPDSFAKQNRDVVFFMFFHHLTGRGFGCCIPNPRWNGLR